MKYGICLSLLMLMAMLCCKSDPSGPEMNCQLKDLYIQEYRFLNAGNVFDVRTDPPTEIKNGRIEYGTSNQFFLHINDAIFPVPYIDYFIDSIRFVEPNIAFVHYSNRDSASTYTYTRDDCGIDLSSPDGELHFELIHGGDELTEKRFAVFDHRTKGVIIHSEYVKLDTFSFIEYRIGPFSTYQDIAKAFAQDHPGQYDTIAIELVQNDTKE